ncbi:glycosyltransferase [Flavobacterium algoritolerans]|uniref:Glycosyltransferase n=1 Tax=Flavobacterium algoritolerans TaxID=3041254 RepID=A0ABT6VEN9_9FLAO|nr:glycosyltransferase [Flavobacterium algoritolerans]MDI5895477.1 glycosyltransferase [Flavobacterium algoritolerans]
MKKKKILFLGESYRADAITWMNGLKEFGDFEIITWELKTPSNCIHNRILRIFEFELAIFKIKKIIKAQQPDMVIAERTTSYGFLAALSGVKPVAIAQQGKTDLWPEKSISLPLKKLIQNYAFKKADLIHAWGPVMTISMLEANVDMNKVLVLPKGIDLTKFGNQNNANPEKICAIVTRSLLPEYRHDIILKSFALLNQKGIDFVLTIIGDGSQLSKLKGLAKDLGIENKVNFTGRIPNTELPKLLQQSNIYISMPITEGVSASLFEAMATNCYPVVTDIAGNQSWIKHRENGQLVTVDDYKMLSEELIWAFENNEHRNEAVLKNRVFLEKNADYNINMKIIANKYHELINTNSSN